MRDEDSPDVRPRTILVEALDRADLGYAALRAVRKEPYFDNVGTLLAVTVGQIAHIRSSSGFDDLIRYPYSADELYWRIRGVEWRRTESPTETRRTWGRLTVDRAGHDAYVDGEAIRLTEKEFALLAYLCERHGRVLTREHLLAQIWGDHYDGSPRTVDVHVSRLRAKLGGALPLQTLRGRRGYRLQMPEPTERIARHAPFVTAATRPSVTRRKSGIPRRFAVLAVATDGVVESPTDA